MGTFPYELSWTPLPSKRRRLNDDLVYILDADQAKELLRDFNDLPPVKKLDYREKEWKQVAVEQHFVTDGYSFPRPAGFPSLMGGKYEVAPKAAVIHDWLCDNKICSRYLTDRIFKRCMKDCGVGWIRRNIIFAGVRAYAIATGLK